MLFLLRLKVWKKWLSSAPKKCGPTCRPTSPPSRWFSILITSAPRSARYDVPNGPAPYCSTATMRRRERGRVEAESLMERSRFRGGAAVRWVCAGTGGSATRTICTDNIRVDHRRCQSRAPRGAVPAPRRSAGYRRSSIR